MTLCYYATENGKRSINHHHISSPMIHDLIYTVVYIYNSICILYIVWYMKPNRSEKNRCYIETMGQIIPDPHIGSHVGPWRRSQRPWLRACLAHHFPVVFSFRPHYHCHEWIDEINADKKDVIHVSIKSDSLPCLKQIPTFGSKLMSNMRLSTQPFLQFFLRGREANHGCVQSKPDGGFNNISSTTFVEGAHQQSWVSDSDGI